MKIIWHILKNYGLSIMLLGFSGMSLCIAGYMLLTFEHYASDSRLTVKENMLGVEHNLQDEYITVDVSGSIRQPGALRLKSGSRLSEALRLSGGVTTDASHEYLQHVINQAQILTDEQKIYIPSVDEYEAEVSKDNATQSIDGSLLQQGSNTDVPQLINLNAASNTQLEELPGIGEITAAKIIASRPYSTLDDLISKKVLTQSVLDKIRAYVKL